MTPVSARVFRLLPLAFAAVALAACETTGTGAPDAAAKPVELPMTHTRAAEQCWMSTEKGAASMSLDKRADLVDKCIDEKMKTASGAAEPAPETKKPEAKKPEAKKKKPDAAADAKKKQPAAAEEKSEPKGEKDKTRSRRPRRPTRSPKRAPAR